MSFSRGGVVSCSTIQAQHHSRTWSCRSRWHWRSWHWWHWWHWWCWWHCAWLKHPNWCMFQIFTSWSQNNAPKKYSLYSHAVHSFAYADTMLIPVALGDSQWRVKFHYVMLTLKCGKQECSQHKFPFHLQNGMRMFAWNLCSATTVWNTKKGPFSIKVHLKVHVLFLKAIP